MAAEIDVRTLIDNRSIGSFQLRILILCFIVAFLDGFDTQIIAVAASSIANAFEIPISSFGPIFGAGQFGLMVGALLLGPFADRLGRKRLLIFSVLVFSLFTLLMPLITTFNGFVICRFLGGLGLGGAMPNIVAMYSEYAPARRRALLITLLWIAIPAGGTSVGLLGSMVLPHLGWQALFMIGGLIPLVVAGLLAAFLPESIAFLAARDGTQTQIKRIVTRVAPELPLVAETRFVLLEEKITGMPVKHLFTDNRGLRTICLWIPFFIAYMMLIFLITWSPALLRLAGLSVAQSSIGLVMANAGTLVGTVLAGTLIHRFGIHRVLAAMFVVFTLGLAGIGLNTTSTFTLIAVFIVISGMMGGATTSGLVALAGISYPTAIRATGVGWAIGTGRLGATAGPVLAGILLSAAWEPRQVCLAMATPGIVAAVVLLILWRLTALHVQPASDGTGLKPSMAAAKK